MKILQSHLVRALVAIVTGALIIKYREETVQWLTIAIGILFFISGVISIAMWWSYKRKDEGGRLKEEGVRRNEENETIHAGGHYPFPLVGLGSVILGVILTVIPTTFITGLMYILAAMLILGAINQYVYLGMATRWCHVGWYYWILPTAILLVSLYVIFKPMETASLPLFIIGWCMLVYGVAECINSLMLFIARRHYKIQQAAIDKPVVLDAEVIEEVIEEG